MAIVVVTDSSSDLGPAGAAEAGLELVPCLVYFGDDVARDGVDMSVSAFYQRLASSPDHPKTTAPPVEAFAETFSKHVAAGNEVVCVTVSSGLSKTFVNASQAATPFAGKVHVVDGKSVSAGTALLATGAARLARSAPNAAPVLAALQKWVGREHGHLVYKDYAFLEQGGRIEQKQILLATKMHLTPLLRIGTTGALESEATGKSWDEALELLVSISARKIERPEETRVAIVHADIPDVAQTIAEALGKKVGHPFEELDLYLAGPTIGANFGPGFLGIFTCEDWA